MYRPPPPSEDFLRGQISTPGLHLDPLVLSKVPRPWAVEFVLVRGVKRGAHGVNVFHVPTHQTHPPDPGHHAGAGPAHRVQTLLTEEEVQFVVIPLAAVRDQLDLQEHRICTRAGGGWGVER